MAVAGRFGVSLPRPDIRAIAVTTVRDIASSNGPLVTPNRF